MPEISLTDFVDFVASSGSPKLTKVRSVKNRDEYNPAFDFWKRFRDGVINFHKSRTTDKKELQKIALEQTDQKKRTAYPAAVSGYQKFLGRKTTKWFDPPTERWSSGGLDVRVNPEVGLVIDGDKYIIKLYLKADPLSKRRVDTILAMMHDSLAQHSLKRVNYCVLDVQRGKMFSATNPDPVLLALLHGEASSFTVVWNNLF